MSINLTNNTVASFDAQVKLAYQGSGMLRGTVRQKTGIIGGTHQFPKMGQGLATPRIPQTDVIPMNIDHTNRVAILTDWNAPEFTDVFNQQKVNYSERAELAETLASAKGRRMDQFIIDAADASGTTSIVAKTVGGNDAMNTSKARKAKKFLDDNDVPASDRTMVITATGLEQMLGSTSVVSSDFNMVKALIGGELDTWLGFKWITLGSRDGAEGGLPLTGTDRTAFAYHKKALGLAVGALERTEVAYINEKTSWLANTLFVAGAIAIDDRGIVDVVFDEAIVVDSE